MILPKMKRTAEACLLSEGQRWWCGRRAHSDNGQCQVVKCIKCDICSY